MAEDGGGEQLGIEVEQDAVQQVVSTDSETTPGAGSVIAVENASPEVTRTSFLSCLRDIFMKQFCK